MEKYKKITISDTIRTSEMSRYTNGKEHVKLEMIFVVT